MFEAMMIGSTIILATFGSAWLVVFVCTVIDRLLGRGSWRK